MAVSQSNTVPMGVRFEGHRVRFEDDQLCFLKSELKAEKVVTVEFITPDLDIFRCEVKKDEKTEKLERFFTLTCLSKDGERLPGHSTVYQKALYSILSASMIEGNEVPFHSGLGGFCGEQLN